MSDQKIFTLSQVTFAIERVIAKNCVPVWVKVEMLKLNYDSRSGHAYPLLVEKVDGEVIAEIRATIWKGALNKINRKFKQLLNQELDDNMTVVLFGNVTYKSKYGIALNITDIDPNFTLGELERQKLEAINKLKKEGVFEANSSTILPIIPKTIAIISVESSKGYQDFLDVINRNQANYKIHYKLFPAILQGERAITTIKQQLENIKQHLDLFDAVVIVRGGGGEVGLSCYDDYSLAKEVATYPIPVLTGIGHSSNLTVTEMVSYESFITPTKIAEFLLEAFRIVDLGIQRFENVLISDSRTMIEDQKSNMFQFGRLFKSMSQVTIAKNKQAVQHFGSTILSSSKKLIPDEKRQLKHFASLLKHNAQQRIQVNYLKLATRMNLLKYSNEAILRKEKGSVEIYENSLGKSTSLITKQAQNRLTSLGEKVSILSPQEVLKRGFSISRLNGKAIKDVALLKEGASVSTELLNGTFESEVTKKNKKK